MPATEGAALDSIEDSGDSPGLLKREGVAHGGGSPTTPATEDAALGLTLLSGGYAGPSGGSATALKREGVAHGGGSPTEEGAARGLPRLSGGTPTASKANDPPDGVTACDDGVGDGTDDGGVTRSSREGNKTESEDPIGGAQPAGRQAMIGARADRTTCAAQTKAAQARRQDQAEWAWAMPIETCAC